MPQRWAYLPDVLEHALDAAEADPGAWRDLVESDEPRPSSAAVVHLRLDLEAEDGQRSDAILAIPKARYDGLRVLELFERHQLGGTTRVVRIGDFDRAVQIG